jgi:lipopolysaccharide transport system ATP-binding protein
MATRPEPSIHFEAVWKKFRRGSRHDTLRDVLASAAWSLVRPTAQRAAIDEFWALKDVGFTVKSGETLGIIGPNGAGKSTILKIVTKILRPTRGRSDVHGRMGALIEIGSGFHGDLTGRENVFLQGAVMGMNRSDVRKRFDDIVEFASIGEFIDTPVKRYSTGMHARLAFSVAAHCSPEVLLIDEVLAVGDLAFQYRAMDRIDQIARTGVPTIIVSHQLERMISLCSSAILLEQGEVRFHGAPADCVDAYVRRQQFTEYGGTAGIRLDSLEQTSRVPVASGEHVTLVLDGTTAAHFQPGSEEIIVRVRGADSGHILFAAGKESIPLGSLVSGPFRLEIQLQMNVRPGLYVVESLVRDQKQTQYLASGPHTSIRVTEGVSFYGQVQMNARARALPLADLAHSTDPAARR